MKAHLHVALVTMLAVMMYFWMATQVARARGRARIPPPAMTGDPALERTLRAHLNTLEWLPIFLPSMWLFAIYWNGPVAAILGAVWIAGRIVYFLGYMSETAKRRPGFFIQAMAAGILLFGALGRIVWLMAVAPAASS